MEGKVDKQRNKTNSSGFNQCIKEERITWEENSRFRKIWNETALLGYE